MAKKPPAPPAPTLPAGKRSPRSTIPAIVPLTITSGVVAGAQRIGVFGTGGIGKSTLAAYLPAPLFIDAQGGTKSLNVARDTVTGWAELRGKLASIAATPPEGVRSVVVDTVTDCEELAKEFVIETRKAKRKGQPDVSVDSIEDFGWGTGWQFVHGEFGGLLMDLDRIVAKGIHVCLIAHEVSTPVPNPSGEDFLRWEPYLYSGDRKGRGSIRDQVKQWTDHLLYVSYDIHVKDGKGLGSGTRSISTQELPTHLAKSRTKQLTQSFELSDPGAVWRELGIS